MKRARPKLKRATLTDQLDKAVETIMSDRTTRLPKVNSRIAGILRVASELRGLPNQDFKARLKQALISRATPSSAVAEQSHHKASPIPEGRQTATTCLVVKESAKAIEFYKRAFGASELMRHADPSGHIVHAEIMIGDTRIALADEAGDYNRSPEALGGSSAIISLYVEDVDTFSARAVAAGAKVVFPIADQFYGDRGGRLADPFGHLWIVSTHIEDVSPEEMNRRMEAYAREQAANPPAKEESKIAVAPRPEGFHSITPYLQVRGAAKLIEFLEQAFGAEEIFRIPRGEEIAHAQLRIADSMIEVADAIDKYHPNPTAIWLFVKDTDDVYRQALKAGATSMHEPMEQDYGERSATVVDPFGNFWYLATPHDDADPPPAGLHNVTPYLHPKGTAKVIDFMKQAFGAEEVFRAQDPAGTIHHAKIRIGDSIIAMGEAHGPYQPMPPALHLYVNDTDAVYQRALQAGATSIDEPQDQGYGDRYAGVKDPFDNVWYIATRKVVVDVDLTQLAKPPQQPQDWQRPGSIMPFMYSEDAVGAFNFYKKVFGAQELHRQVQPDGRISHIGMTIGETHVMLRDATTKDLADYRAKGFAATPHQLGGTPLHLYIYVDDADAAFKRAIDSGSKLVDPMEDKEWGDRCGGVQDPFGHIWYIATPLKHDSH